MRSLLIILIGILLHRLLFALARSRRRLGRAGLRLRQHAAWSALAWVLSIMAGLGIVTGAVFLMPAVTAFVGSFFVDEIADAVEREYYPAEPPGRALPFLRALIEGVKIALLALLVYLCALPFMLFAGLGVVMLFLANSYLLGRKYFELAAMRFRPPYEAKAMRQRQRRLCFPRRHGDRGCSSRSRSLNLATPIFAMAFMVHIHKRLSGRRDRTDRAPR